MIFPCSWLDATEVVVPMCQRMWRERPIATNFMCWLCYNTMPGLSCCKTFKVSCLYPSFIAMRSQNNEHANTHLYTLHAGGSGKGSETTGECACLDFLPPFAFLSNTFWLAWLAWLWQLWWSCCSHTHRQCIKECVLVLSMTPCVCVCVCVCVSATVQKPLRHIIIYISHLYICLEEW